jgi:membrane associated rhomboid family serine protease
MPYRPYTPGLTRVVKYLLAANVVLFLAMLHRPLGLSLVDALALTPTMIVDAGRVWQLFTYMFLHGGLLHLLFNMFILWMFGSELERYFGSREFFKYYCVTGVGAGILTWLTSFNSPVPVVGASGAIYGLLLAYGLHFPNRLVYLWFFVPIKAKHLVIFLAVFEFVAGLSSTSSGIAHFAHLGGMLVGFFYLKSQEGYSWQRLGSKWTRWWRTRGETRTVDLEDEVDRILEKISQEGMESLSDREKKILDFASNFYEDGTD